jgi:hypothetical protein
MSVTVICQGCGQLVPVAEGYRRNKIQCPACGVICPVPAGAAPAKKAAAPAPARPAFASPFEDPLEPEPPAPEWPAAEVAPAPEPEESAAAPLPAKKPAAAEWRVPCRRCGRMVRRQGECPSCDGEAAPAAGERGGPALSLSLDEPPAPDQDPEDDGQPYLFEGGEESHCPRCRKPMKAGDVVCVSCGFHLRRRKKLVKEYQPLVRQWETNHPFRWRLTLLVTVHGLSLVLGLIATLSAGEGLAAYLAAWLFGGMMMAFLLGTYERIDLTRDRRGRVELTQTWRLCFLALRTTPVPVRGHAGVVTGRSSEAGFWEWFILLCLLPGLIPAVIWWYVTIHKVRFHVALSRDHGYPATRVYRGWNEEQMNDIAQTLSDASGLRWDRG